MAQGWDWQQKTPNYYDHGNWLASQRPQQSGGGSGMQASLGAPRLPQMPNLSIPGVAPSPQLPQFDNSLPSLAAPNMPGMTVPQLNTNLNLPGYQRQDYQDLSGGFSSIQDLLLSMMGGQQNQGGSPNANVTSAINASPLYGSSAAGLVSSVGSQGNRGLGTPMARYATPAQQSALGQQYGANAQREAGINSTNLQRQMAGNQAGFGLQAESARSNSGMGLMDLMAGNWAQDQQMQNTQRNGLLGLLMGMI
jgi:hypothetical protein